MKIRIVLPGSIIQFEHSRTRMSYDKFEQVMLVIKIFLAGVFGLGVIGLFVMLLMSSARG